MIKQKITVINKLGIHARAAAKLVNTADRFVSEIKLVRDEKQIDAKSILDVMMLAVSCGTELEVIVDGEDEQDAMLAIEKLINERFGESE